MSFRQLILCSCLREADSGLIEVLPRHGPLLKQFLPAVIDLLLSVEHLFGGLRIKRSLLYFFRQAGCCSRNICGFGLFKCAFVLFLGRCQIRVLQNGQQLASAHLASPCSVKLFYRRTDLWHYRRLLQRKQYSIRRDDALNGCFLSVRGGDRNGSFFGFLLRTADG